MTRPANLPIRGVWTNDVNTMAAETARTRWPRTIQSMVDDIARSAALTANSAAAKEGKGIADRLSALRRAIESDAALLPLEDDGRPDIQTYNSELRELGGVTWLAVPWLYAECYMYRLVQGLLSTSNHWKGYDVFKRQKDSTFAQSHAAVTELSARYLTVSRDLACDIKGAPNQSLFEEMTQIALWGNATDLSLLSKLSLEDIQSLQGAAAIEKNQRNIIVNDVADVWRYMRDRSPGRVDIVLDNAGFEFLTDLIYASYLLDSGLAESVVLHTKEFPWFVSDVTPTDVETTLKDLESSTIFPSRHALDPLVGLLRAHFRSGKISVQQHDFWTLPCSFHRLPVLASDLFAEMRKSVLVIFKGDLNYRKLVADGLWPHTTPFKEALGPMGAGSCVKLLALRTNKADVCVGVPDADTVSRLESEAPSSGWTKSGKYAVISFSDGI